MILCVGTILTLKKLGVRGAATKPDETQSMTVVDRTSINNKCELQLVQIKNQKVLIGVDQNGIKSMTYIPNSFTDEFDSAVDTPRKI